MAKKYVENISEIIIDNVDIVDFISRYVRLKKSGNNYKGLCPFHSENTPSFFVSNDKQLFNCFGCSMGGNIISFVSEIENLDFIDTIEYIADTANLDLSPYINDNESYSKEYQKRKKILNLNRQAAIYFYRNLSKSKKAMNYLKNRDIDQKTIKKFALGYAKDDWEGLMDYLLNKGFKKEFLYNSGLISKSNKSNKYYDRFRDRIMFPIFDYKGKILAFGGRIIKEDDKAPKYLNSPETYVFNKSSVLYGLKNAKKNIRDKNYLILVEGYMDVIMLNRFGVENVVAALGTSFTKKHSRLINKYIDEVIICFDPDNAGIKATKRAINKMKNIVLKVKVVELEEEYDPDDYIREYGKDKYLEKIKKAKTSHMYLIDKLYNSLSFDNEYDFLEFIQETKKILNDIDDYTRAHYYVKKISKMIDMPKDSLLDELFDNISKNKKRTNDNSKKINKYKLDSSDTTSKKYEKNILKYALIDKSKYNEILDLIDLNLFINEEIVNIFEFLEKYYKENDTFVLNRVLDHLPVDQAKICQELLNNLTIEKNYKKNISIYMKKIEIEYLNNKIKNIQYELKRTTDQAEMEALIIKEDNIKREIRALKKR